MDQPKISIIIPIYNSEKYLKSCLDSVCSQTYPNIEIICVNDGSTDTSPDIIQSYAKKDDRFVVINQKNNGLSYTRNVGVNNATGEWISFVDSDDYISCGMCQGLISALSHADFDIYMFNGVLMPEGDVPEGTVLRKFFYDSNWNTKESNLYSFKDCKNPFYGNLSVWNKIYSKKFIDSSAIKFKENITFEDQLYTVEAMIKAKTIYIDNRVFYYYVQHGSSIMHSLKENAFDIFEIMSDVRKLLVEHDLYDYEKYVFLQHKYNVYNYLFSLVDSSVKPKFYETAKQNLVEEFGHGFSTSLVRKLGRNNLFFDFLNLTSEQYAKKYGY